MFYLSFILNYAVFALETILCLCAVGCLTGCALVVASVFVVLLWGHLTTESMVKIWRL